MPTSTNRSGPRAGQSDLRRPVIIVIDDDEAVRDSLKAVLESRDFTVLDFGSGLRFLEFYGNAARGQVACLIVATHVADITGMDLVRLLRAQRDFVPVILTTGQRSAPMEAGSIATGAIALLDKPISPTLLFAALQRALSAR